MKKIFVSIVYKNSNCDLNFFSDFYIFGGDLDESIIQRIKIEFSERICCVPENINILSITYLQNEYLVG